MTLYEKLLECRKAKGLSQSDVAEFLDVSRQSVSHWEVGSSVPNIDNLIRLSRLYEVSLDELLSRSAPKSAPAEEEPAPAPAEEQPTQQEATTAPAEETPTQQRKEVNPWKIIAGILALAVVILAVALCREKQSEKEVISVLSEMKTDRVELTEIFDLGNLE